MNNINIHSRQTTHAQQDEMFRRIGNGNSRIISLEVFIENIVLSY